MRDRDGDELDASRRGTLLAVALLFVAGCAVLSLGLRAVPKTELAAVTAAIMYVLAASVLQPAPPVPSVAPGRIKPLALDRQLSRATIRFFLVTSFVLSLVAPWIWIAYFEPSYQQLQLLGPHLFLMMAQVLFEVWSYRTTVSVVIRVGIPVAFVSYRMRVLVAWVQDALVVENKGLSDKVMVALASANVCFWGFMLFYILLLKVCPPYFLERDQFSKKCRSRTN